ncbi:MBL fold metallo-hydrolase [Spirosoma taeanense]|uniref:MBL fold metallo-hydrolase n=1 Tax=Spirosoma taeanense TaxID=2735870 RepID=A0A6M5YBD5_9BACT|nr:MBL fold metallo-hydrolase [Spirosoma taeanense]QJW90202.1 MBL fold metallo-hydrolase [Spirosoma taeanense]
MYHPANEQLSCICATCGTQYDPVNSLPGLCRICNDDRQYIGDAGQTWISWAALANDRTIRIQQLQPELFDLRITPSFAIGQKAHLLLSEAGNLLWDCLPFLDEPTIAFIRSKGGLRGIAISHPHYYSLMNEWAAVFDCPVYLHANDRQWIMNPSDRLHRWSGETMPLWANLSIVNTGGHFPGSCVLYAPHLSDGNGALLAGDSIYVTRDRRGLTFMYSYPNHLPLRRNAVEQIRDRVAPLAFDSIYGAFDWQRIDTNGHQLFDESIWRYLAIFD